MRVLRSRGRAPARAGLVLALTVALALPAVASARGTAAAALPRCSSGGLVVWLDTQADHAAGSAYYKLEFTNLSMRACTLRGYPGVSAVDLTRHRLGDAASRNPAHPVAVTTLAGGATVTAVLQIVDVHNFPAPMCRPRTAAGLRVTPPGQSTAKVVPFPFDACRRRGPSYLHVEAVR